MTLLEISLLLTGILLPFISSFRSDRTALRWMALLPLAGLTAHALVDGLRWQMSPIYLFLGVLLVSLLFGKPYFRGHWWWKTLAALFAVLCLSLGYLLATALPIFKLPPPTGPHAVGSEYLHLVTPDVNVFTDQADEWRELMIKAWYPARASGETPEAFWNKGERVGFAAKYGLPAGQLDYLDRIRTHTLPGAAVAEGAFPVLLFSHGQYSPATGYYALLQELASHGFIILNINHTYESTGSLFPDGSIRLYDQAYDRHHNNAEMAELIWQTMEAYRQTPAGPARDTLLRGPLKEYFAAEITRRWSGDIGRVLEQLPTWNQQSPLAGHLDTTRVGVFGHSQGGAAAGQALVDYPMLRAGVNVDGVQWGPMVDTSLARPFLLLSSDWPAEHPDFNPSAYRGGSSADFYEARIAGTGHASFMDIPYLFTLSALNEGGTIEPARATQISASVIRSFFDRYLRGAPEDLLKTADSFPELSIRRRE